MSPIVSTNPTYYSRAVAEGMADNLQKGDPDWRYDVVRLPGSMAKISVYDENDEWIADWNDDTYQLPAKRIHCVSSLDKDSIPQGALPVAIVWTEDGETTFQPFGVLTDPFGEIGDEICYSDASAWLKDRS